MKSYDLVVIGGGSAGYAAARSAAALGARVAVIEGGEEIGGLCILRGCMPTKALLESAHRVHEVNRAAEFGIEVGRARPNWPKIQARKDWLIEDFASYRRQQLTKGDFTFVRGCAHFIDAHTLVVTGKSRQSIRGKAFIIATGSVVSEPALPGLQKIGFITSDEALQLRRPLKSIVVLGGGAVALEFAQYFQHLGVRTTLIQRSAQVLSKQDADWATVLTEVFQQEGMQVYLGTELLQAKQLAAGKQVVFRQGNQTRKVVAEEILYALGRTPNTASLALPSAGVKLAGRRILVNSAMRTSVPHIFAAGDVCGPYEVVHIAIQQAEIAARNAVRWLRGETRRERMDYRLKMEVVFTAPELATVGLSEKEAAAKGWKVLTAKYPFADHGKSMIMGASAGFVKIIAAAAVRGRRPGEILGAQIAGPHAADLIHEFVVAMHYRATVQEFLRIPHYHPTLAEIVTYPAEEIAERLASQRR